VCGDFNDAPGSRAISLMKEDFLDCWESAGTGSGFTFRSDSATKRIDYIFFSKPPREDSLSARASLRPRSARVVSSFASDHLPVVVDFDLTTDR
jgi:endonuclease/exonuclease/phosphatase (EEP) superfamily protein YafD